MSGDREQGGDLTRSEEYALEEIREMLGQRPALVDRLRAELVGGTTLPESEPRLRVLSVIADHIEDENFTAAGLGSAIGLSRSSLERNCRNFFGLTPGSLIRLVRLEEAARILATTDEDVGQVAFAVGYSGASQFTRAFRQCYGSSPTVWRERARSSRPR